MRYFHFTDKLHVFQRDVRRGFISLGDGREQLHNPPCAEAGSLVDLHRTQTLRNIVLLSVDNSKHFYVQYLFCNDDDTFTSILIFSGHATISVLRI